MADTYYVSAATGDDGDNGLSEENAFATIQQALDTVAAGDIVHIKGDGEYNEILRPSTVGTIHNPIQLQGYTTTPRDGGMAQVDGNGKNLASGLACGGGNWYYVWTNIRFTDFSDRGVDSALANHLMFRYCEFDNNGGWGAAVKDSVLFVGCHSHDNVGLGIYGDGACVIVGCLCRDNGNNGIQLQGVDNIVLNCTLAGNGYIGIHLNYGENCIVGNTIWGDNKKTNYGIACIGTSSYDVLMNNIITECGEGIHTDWGTTPGWKTKLGVLHNCLYGNTTDYVYADTDIGEITSDPKFKDASGGDFTLAADSPALNVGVFPVNVPNAPTQAGDTHFLGCASSEAAGGGGGGGGSTVRVYTNGGLP